MKVRVYSDIHLDHYADAFQQTKLYDPSVKEETRPHMWYPPELPDDKETILILAGDIWIGTRWIEYGGFSWIGEISKQFKRVLVVLGNHCYWPQGDLSVVAGADKCNALLQDMKLDNVLVLDKNTYEDGEYLFVGATLWTDMNNLDPLAMYNMSRFMTYDGKIAYETGPNGQWTRFTSERWVQTHDTHKKYLRLVIEQNRDKKIVVITHHVPLLHLGDPRFAGDSSNAYYMSDQSNLILDNDHVILWVYGHTHHQKDVVFPDYAGEGGCRMVNNCVGYQGEHFEQQDLVKHEVIEI